MTKAEQASQLIFKRAPIGWNDDDYDVLADGKLVGRIFKVPIAPQAALGCGRAATIAVYTTRPTATSRRARTRWRRSPRVGGGEGTELISACVTRWPDTPIWGFTRQLRSASTDGPQLEAVWRDALIKYRLFPPACERWCSIR